MSEEKPRLSRREMRERGLLGPVTDGPSPIEELSRTQEITLNRLSRKEMRERERNSKAAVESEVEAAKQEAARRDTEKRAAEEAARRAAAERASAEAAARAAANRERIAQAQRADAAAQEAARHEREQAEQAAAKASADLEAAEARIAENADAQKAASNGRRSVFDRFEGGSRAGGASARSALSASSVTSGSAASASAATVSSDVAGGSDLAPGTDVVPSADPAPMSSNASLQDRLLDRMRKGGFSQGPVKPENTVSEPAGARGAEKEEEAPLVSSADTEDAHRTHHTLGGAVTGSDSWDRVEAKEETRDQDSKDDGDTSVPTAGSHAPDWTDSEDVESEYDLDDLQEEKSHGVLLTLIGILIGIVLGIIVGLLARQIYLHFAGAVDPLTIIASVRYLNPLL